ncbi:hypothetical protein LCGC14_0319830 [marine sediment metagenome]|uniref:Uncharacterized protein n=1 Tax=marine sediment metagenome TaxID=412755 RepID=A0A0F9TJJ3_9ZZZZ
MTEKITKVIDPNWTLVATPVDDGDGTVIRVEFELFETVRNFPKNVDDQELYAHGRVKWDGCSDWWFDRQSSENSESTLKRFLHFCEEPNVGGLMSKVYFACGEMMDAFEGTSLVEEVAFTRQQIIEEVLLAVWDATQDDGPLPYDDDVVSVALDYARKKLAT